MDRHTQDYQAACLRSMQQLIGKRIVKLIKDPTGFSGFELEDGTRVWILCDPEGNGPGFAEIVPGAHFTKG